VTLFSNNVSFFECFSSIVEEEALLSPELGGRRPEDLPGVEDEGEAAHVLRCVIVRAEIEQEAVELITSQLYL
jgi:hypothetical protein